MKKIAFIVAFVFASLPAFSQDEIGVEAFLKDIYNKVAVARNNDNGDYRDIYNAYTSRRGIPEAVKSLNGYTDYLIENKQ